MLLGQHDFEPPGLILMGAFLIDGVYTDPCAHVLGPKIGSGVDALVAALRGVKELHATAPDEATVDGRPATHLALEYGNIDPSSCSDNQFDMWAWQGEETRYVPTGYEGHAGRDDLWILDVGGTRVALIGGLSDGTDADRAELAAMIRSIRFR